MIKTQLYGHENDKEPGRKFFERNKIVCILTRLK